MARRGVRGECWDARVAGEQARDARRSSGKRTGNLLSAATGIQLRFEHLQVALPQAEPRFAAGVRWQGSRHSTGRTGLLAWCCSG